MGFAPNLPVKLSAGALTALTLTATGVKHTLTLNWQGGSGVGWQPIPGMYPFTAKPDQPACAIPMSASSRRRRSPARLSLDADEIAYLGYDPVQRDLDVGEGQDGRRGR